MNRMRAWIKTSLTAWSAAAVLAVLLLLDVNAPIAAGGGTEGGGQPFADCGTIHVDEAGGTFFTSFETHNGSLYPIDNPMGFGDGDQVCISGYVSSCAPPPGFPGGPIQGCVTVISAVLQSGLPFGAMIDVYSACGEFEVMLPAEGDPCILFHAQSGATFRVVGQTPNPSVIGQGTFNVAGILDFLNCSSPCGDVSGCLFSPALGPCMDPADLNHDGAVNGLDIGVLLASWGQTGPADLNADGVVNGLDVGILLAHWS